MDNKTNERSHRRGPDLRKGVYIVPSLLTTANIFCGFYSVLEALKGFQKVALSFAANDLNLSQAAIHHFDVAAMCIGFSVLFDFLDGRIARMTNTTSEFGVELDSLADVLSFGIAPAVLAYAWGYSPIIELQKVGWAVSFMFLVCGALRLARFNVLARKPSQDKTAKKYFVGMPIPAGASLIAAIVHFTPTPIIMRKTQIDLFGQVTFDASLYSVMLMMLTALLALLMVSTVRYSNFKGSSGKPGMSRNQTVLLAAIMVIAIYQWSQVVLLIMATCYVSLGPVAKILSFVNPRPSNEEHTENVSSDVSLNQQS